MKTSKDLKLIKLALSEAKKSLDRGDLPVGAVLAIDGKIVDKTNNALLSKSSWGDHAETQLILKHSQVIREAKKNNSRIDLYTTLEPCLMCLGCATLHRVDRIIFSCPDPRGGATIVDVSNLPSFYKDHWPKIESGMLRQEAYEMLMDFMKVPKSPQWKINKVLFEKMAKEWSK